MSAIAGLKLLFMETKYNLDVSFPSINLDSYDPDYEKCEKSHNAQIISEKNKIELRIYYNSKTNFDRKLSLWSYHLNWKDFGKYIKTSNFSSNQRIKNIDLSESQIISTSFSSSYDSNNISYISVFINCIKLILNPNEDKKNTSEFYLNDSGFKMVSSFYATLFQNEEKFTIRRMDKRETFYKIGNAEFRPEFNFFTSDARVSKEAKIIKEPKIQFRYNDNIKEKDAIRYAEIVCLLSSFYYNVKIDYTVAKIYLTNKTIIIQKVIEQQLLKPTVFGLRGVGYNKGFHFLLSSNWQNSAQKNFKKLCEAIEKYNQSRVVDGSSKFLLRYNIIEICKSGKRISSPEFEIVLNNKEVKNKYDQALTKLLETISDNEQGDFKIKWESIKNKLKYKSMKSPIEEFLKTQKLKPEDFPISLKDIIQMRSDLTHGSINSISPEKLENANVILYRITGILIMNLFGINEWEFDKHFN